MFQRSKEVALFTCFVVTFFLAVNSAAFGSSLKASGNYDVGNRPVAIAAGDFRGDGRVDLAVANAGGKTVSVLLNRGDATFSAAAEYEVGVTPGRIVVTDVNGDGRADIAVEDAAGMRISVLLGRGDGTFLPHAEMGARQAPELSRRLQLPVTAHTGTQTASVVFADFNGDGRMDEAVAMSGKNMINVLLSVAGNGGGSGTDILLNSGFESGTLSPWFQGRNFCGGGGCEPWADLLYHPIQGSWDAGNEGNMELRQNFSATDTSTITRVAYWVRQPNAAIAEAFDFFYTDGSDEEFVVFLNGAGWQSFDVTADLAAGKSLTGFSLWGFSSSATTMPITFLDGVEILVN